MANKLIKRIVMQCPVCGKKHEVEELSHKVTTIIKNEKVRYDESCYICSELIDDNEFETGELVNRNIRNAQNSYRKAHGLLTTDEIVEIRECYGLTQVELANLLGWGEATISRYESKAIQDESYDMMLRLIKDNPVYALQLLEKNSARFIQTRKTEIRNNIVSKLNIYEIA